MDVQKNLIEEALRRACNEYGDDGSYKITPYWGFNGGHAPASGCFGVITDVRGYSLFLLSLEDVWSDNEAMKWHDPDDFVDLLAGLDSTMITPNGGELSMIYYFPAVTVVE